MNNILFLNILQSEKFMLQTPKNQIVTKVGHLEVIKQSMI